MSRRWWMVGAVLVVALALLGLWLRRESVPAAPAPDEVRVRRGDLAPLVEATGRVEATRRATLSLPVGGPVAALLVEVGDEVAVGQPLLQLDPAELTLRLHEAQAALDATLAQQAQATAPAPAAELAVAQGQLRAAQLALVVAEARLAALPEAQRASSEELVQQEQARVAVEQARAALSRLLEGATLDERAVLAAQQAQAEARLALTQGALDAATLHAPFAGTVTALQVRAGERANTAQPLVTLADLASLIVAADVDEVDVGRVAVGQAVTVTLDAFPARPLVGTVRRIAPAASEQRGATSYRTEIAFEQGGLPLFLDMAADLRIRTEGATDALLLPLAAIRYAEAQPYILVWRAGSWQPQEVTLGPQDEREVVLLVGVEEGERVQLP